MTTPSYAWTRSRSPSTTLICTTTVSPGLNAGTLRVMRSASSVWIIFIVLSSSLPSAVALLLQKLLQQGPALAIERRAADQIRPAQPGAADALPLPPALDRGVIAGTEHRWHLAAL